MQGLSRSQCLKAAWTTCLISGAHMVLVEQSCPLIYTEEARKHETFSRKLKGAACLNVLCLVLSQLSFTT